MGWLTAGIGLSDAFTRQRAGGGGDPTRITPANADDFLASLGLTPAGTGTAWGETGQAATPLYAVAADKVPLAVETVGGKQYWGPLVNPAGTNLVLQGRNLTTGWTLTGCTAALTLGGLERGAEWLGDDAVPQPLNFQTASWQIPSATATIDGPQQFTVTADGGGGGIYVANVLTVGKSYIAEWSDVSPSIDIAIELRNSNLGIFADPLLSADIRTPGSIVFVAQQAGIYLRRPAAAAGTVVTVGFLRVREVDTHALLTATSANATATQAITSSSGERVSKFWVQTDDTGVFVSQGAVTGSPLYSDDFSTDTSGEWTAGGNTGNGTIAVSGGDLVHTRGSTDGSFAERVRTITGFVVGRRYRVDYAKGGTAGANGFARISPNSSGGGNIVQSSAATGPMYFQATATTLYFASVNGGTTGQTVTFGDITVTEVAETELTPGANPVPVNLPAATFANPQMAIRIAGNGDSVRVYGVQHQVAARPLRPYIGPTVASSVTTGARTAIVTLSETPSLVHLKIRAKTPTVNISGLTLFSVDNNAATNLIDLKANGSGGYVLRKVIASSETAFTAFNVAVDTLFQIEVEISASVFRYRIDGGTWVDGTAGIPGSLSRFRVCHDNANAGQWGAVPVALDELSTAAMMTGLRGWNKEALL